MSEKADHNLSGDIGLCKSFKEYYFAIVSIIQGVAFAYWINTANELLISDKHPPLMVWFYLALSFSIICFVVYEYTTVASIFTWNTRIWDVLLPFAVATCQIAGILSLQQDWDFSSWWLSLAVLIFVSTFGCLNSYLSIRLSAFKAWGERSIDALKICKQTLLSSIGFCILDCLLCLGMALFIKFYTSRLESNILANSVSIILAVVLIATILTKERIWIKKLSDLMPQAESTSTNDVVE